MAQRILDTAFWDDEVIASLSRDERLLFACMVTDTSLSDDFGVLPANPRILKKHAFGYDDDVTIEQVLIWRDEIIAKSRGQDGHVRVVLGSVNGQEYIYLVNFPRWQQLRHHRKSNYPSSDEVVKASQNTKTSTDCGNLPQNSGKVPQNSGTFPLDRIGLNSVGLNSVGENRAEIFPAPSEKSASAREAETDAPPAPSKNLDPLAHALAVQAQGLDNAGVGDASQDAGQFLKFHEEVLAIFQECGGQFTGNAAAREVQRNAILALALEPDFSPQKWRDSITSCILGKVQGGNIQCMIDTYHAGGNYQAMRAAQKGRNDNGRNSSHTARSIPARHQEYKIADAADFDPIVEVGQDVFPGG